MTVSQNERAFPMDKNVIPPGWLPGTPAEAYPGNHDDNVNY